MARYTFFSFDYEDVKNFKVNVVRKSWITHSSEETFVDGSIWEKSKSKGVAVIKRLIHEGLKQTSVTAVLIGQGTAGRRWVNYEIIKSFERGNGILGIHINRIRGKIGMTKRGLNPLDRLGFTVSEDGRKVYFWELIARKWQPFSDLPIINNKKSNTLYFEDHWWKGNDFGEFFKFSDYFGTYGWKFDDGHKNFPEWVEDAAEQAGR